MHEICVSKPRSTATDVKEMLGPAGDQVCVRTIQRGMITAGCLVFKPRKRPLITVVQQAKRLKWPLNTTIGDKMIGIKCFFSDETMIQLNFNGSPRFVRLVEGTPLTKDHYVSTVKHPLQVMFWACFSHHGTGRSHIVEGNMNTAYYISEIIDNILCQQLRDWYPSTRSSSIGIFQQDNAPCHVSKRAREHFHSRKIRLLDWPPCSPDLNPIENFWSIAKRRIRKLAPKNKADLIAAFLQVWHNDEELIAMTKKLVLSMPNRVQKCIDANGGSTGY